MGRHLTRERFEDAFVNSFEPDSSRHRLYALYLKYTNALSDLLSQGYYQWIDGSFVSTKVNSRDVDVVTFVHYQDYEKHLRKIDFELAGSNARSHYQVDAYIVPEYPEEHRKFAFTRSDKLYWQSLFNKTRVNRAKKQHDKGFIHLNFEGNERSSY